VSVIAGSSIALPALSGTTSYLRLSIRSTSPTLSFFGAGVHQGARIDVQFVRS
jgi:hypothetical protein